MSTLQAALNEWAEQQECAEIDLQESHEFAQIWIWSITAATAVILPVWWCGCLSHKHLDGDDEHEQAQHMPSPSPQGTPSAVGAKEPVDWDNPTPDIKKAKMHLKNSSCTYGEGKWLSVLGFSVNKMNEIGGTGIELYFKMLRTLGYAFAFMAMFSFPLLGFSLVGNFAPDTGNKLTQSTIGNLGMLAISGLPPEQRYVIMGCQGVELTVLTKYFGWLDFLGTCAFLLFVLYFRFVKIPKVKRHDQEQTTSCRDFAVMIDHLPPFLGEDVQGDYENLLGEHVRAQLERNTHRQNMTAAPIEVCEVSLVRDMKRRLSSVVSRAEMIHTRDISEFHGNQKKVDKLNTKIEKLTTKLGTKLDESSLPVLRAYTILNTPEDVRFLLQDYRFSAYGILRCCQSRRRRFRGTAIRIQRAPEPTDIIWENQDMQFKWRLIRKVLMFLIFLFIIAVSLITIYLLMTAAKKQTASVEPSLGISECDAYPAEEEVKAKNCNVMEASAWNISYAQSLTGDDRDCFCATQGYDKVVGDSEIRSVCLGWLGEVATAAGIMGMFSMAVVFINIVVKYILIELANFERPLSMSSLNASMMIKVALAQILNMSLIVTLVDWHAPEWIQTIFSFPLGSMMFRGYYNDIVRGWYARVGSAILLNMLLNTFTAAGSNAAMAVLKSLGRCCCRRKMKHQAELIELYTNPEFEIATRYAQLLATVFCTMMYSSGLPLLNLFAVAFMFITYWTDKTLLLWFSKRPPIFDAQMAVSAANSLMFAAIIHCCVAIVMYGQQCTFPSAFLGGSLGSLSNHVSGQAKGHFEVVFDEMMNRIRKESTWMLFALALFLIGVQVFWLGSWILGGSVGAVLRFIATLCPQRRRVKPGDVDDRDMQLCWAKAYTRIESTFPPASYRLDRHPEYRRLARVLNEKATGSLGDTLNSTATSVTVWNQGSQPDIGLDIAGMPNPAGPSGAPQELVSGFVSDAESDLEKDRASCA